MDLYYCSKLIVTVGGESGTGKTEVATILQDTLWNKYKKRVKIVHIDDFYFTNWLERNTLRRKKGISSVGMKEIDWKKLDKLVSVFKSGAKYLHVQKIHKYTNSMENSIALNGSIDILIVEGLYANALKNSDLNIYLDGSYEDTEDFRKKRNKEPINCFRKKVLAKEQKDIIKTKKYSNIVIPFNVRTK